LTGSASSPRNVVVDETVRVHVGAGQAEADVVGERAAHRTAHLVAGTAVHAGFDAALELVAGLLGIDRDGAADGVATIERALGPAQHLDLLDIEQLLVELRRVGHQHAVDQHGGGELGVPRLGDTADVQERVARVLRLHQRDVGRQVDEVLGRLIPADWISPR
jgi:hypothetical protein